MTTNDPTSEGSIRRFYGRRKELKLLKELVERPFTPIFVTGSAGIGKSALVDTFAYRLPPFTTLQLELSSAEPVKEVEAFLKAVPNWAAETGNRQIVTIDSLDGFTPAQVRDIVRRLFNYKRVKSVIVTRQSLDFELLRAIELKLEPLRGRLYNVQRQILARPKEIIQLAAPQIISVNDDLIKKLKHSPQDLFKISPRQFEEVIAELLSDMGMDVELTQATRDGGKDILAYMDTDIGRLLCLVEAKRYDAKRPVGVSLIRTLYGSLADHQATIGMLVTTSRFAKPAQEFQERHKYQLSLKDYGDVVSWLLKYKSS